MNRRGRGALGLVGLAATLDMVGGLEDPQAAQRRALEDFGKALAGKKVAAIAVPPGETPAVDFIFEDGTALRCFGAIGIVEDAYSIKPRAGAPAEGGERKGAAEDGGSDFRSRELSFGAGSSVNVEVESRDGEIVGVTVERDPRDLDKPIDSLRLAPAEWLLLAAELADVFEAGA